MAYVLLIVGTLFIIYGLKSVRNDHTTALEPEIREISGGFQNILLGSEIIHKLEQIDGKIDLISSKIAESSVTLIPDRMEYDKDTFVKPQKTQLSIGPEGINDINRKILLMKNNGMEVEEIADELGLMKGEILLRLGMKK